MPETVCGRCGKGRLTGPQWHNPFKAGKTLDLPYDTMCRMVDVGILNGGGWFTVLNEVFRATPRLVDDELVYR